MNRPDSRFLWSFSIGTWFATRVRVNVLVPLAILLLMVHLGTQIGLLAGGLMLLSLLAHEFGHIFGARATGGFGDEIMLSPLGGVAMVQPAGTFAARLIVPASGPLVNLVLCLASGALLLDSGTLSTLLNPLNYDELQRPAGTGMLVCTLMFAINWLMLLINMIPVYPLDGGRILQAVLSEHLGVQASSEIYLRVGTVFGVGFVVIGLLLNTAVVVFVGTIVWVMNLEETSRLRSADVYDDSFMGYDFSQGYTSLERSGEPSSARGRNPGWLKRWRQQRQQRRDERDRERTVQEERQLDEILARLHEQGPDSLTESERRVLKRASNRYRNRDDA